MSTFTTQSESYKDGSSTPWEFVDLLSTNEAKLGSFWEFT